MSQNIKHFPVKDGQTTFGMHLMLDAYNAPRKSLDDMKLVFKYLNELPELIGMKKISSPMVVNAQETKSGFDPGGISGVVLISESHISLHTFADKGFLTMDLYSCSDFEDEVQKIINYTQECFPFTKHSLKIVKRGLEYPM